MKGGKRKGGTERGREKMTEGRKEKGRDRRKEEGKIKEVKGKLDV